MMMSCSTPFSLATASMNCCNGFGITSDFQLSTFGYRLSALGCQLKLHFQIRSRDHAERHAVPLAILSLDEDRAVLDAAQRALEERLTVHRFAHDHFRAAAGEPPVI